MTVFSLEKNPDHFLSKSIKLNRLFLPPVNVNLLSFTLSCDRLNSEAKLNHWIKKGRL